MTRREAALPMHHPTLHQFRDRARQGNLVPVWREMLADQESPVSAYARLRAGRKSEAGMGAFSFLLESVEGGEHLGRFSFLGTSPALVLKATGTRVEITRADGTTGTREGQDPLAVLAEEMARFRPVPDPALPRFFGGAVGFLGYDQVASFEPVPLPGAEGLGGPDSVFCLADSILVFDRARQTIKVVVNAHIEDDPDAAYAEAVARIDALVEQLGQPVAGALVDAGPEPEAPEAASNLTRPAYEAGVERAREYIRAGDVIQVVLSQRFSVPYAGEALDVYRALRSINPSPYMFCLEFDDLRLVGSSPEIHVRCEDGKVEGRPIAGTRPRADSAQADDAAAQELLADPKERAEHIMLVDLARNDIGRVCEYRSVEVPELMVIERYSHVMHIVSDVTGRLAPGRDVYGLMRATFPAGTVSGAPKVRAMQIIGELEPDRRGAYAGAVCYFSYTGNLDSCITIRTVQLTEGRAHVQAGAGIVADSVPAREFEETRNKARGMLKAIALAERFAAAREETRA